MQLSQRNIHLFNTKTISTYQPCQWFLWDCQAIEWDTCLVAMLLDMRHAALGQQWTVLGLFTPNRSKWSKVSIQVCPTGSCSTPLRTTFCHVNARHVYTIHFKCHRFQSISKPMQAKLSPLEILNPESTFTFSLRGTKRAGFHKTFGYPPSFSQHFHTAFILAVIWLAAGNAATQITWRVKDLNGQSRWKRMLQQYSRYPTARIIVCRAVDWRAVDWWMICKLYT